jgi:hypothetical protein
MLATKSNITPDKFEALMQQKYNRKSFRGLELLNAAGDINPNGLAFQYTLDRLTYIRSGMVEQTFYEVSPAEYVDIIPGEGAFGQAIITNTTYKVGTNFQAGKIDTARANARVNTADAALYPVTTYIQNWAMGCDYTIFDINQAAFTGSWDLIEAKQRSRKKLWDLGIQAVTFVGDTDNATNFPGLLTNSTVNINTTVLNNIQISAQTAAQFATTVSTIIGAFLTNAAQTVFPNTLIIPQDDYAGLATPVSSTYPNISMLSYLQQAFNQICPGGNFKILPSAYAIGATASGGGTIGHHRYMLYRRDIDTIFQELPLDYTVTAQGTYNNFNFQDVAYGQYCGPTILKYLEVLYLDLNT